MIVDDDPEMISTLCSLLSEKEAFEVIGIATSYNDSLKLLENTVADLAFLDIMIENKTIFDVLRNLNNVRFSPVFITSHEEFALEAIRFSALDYLLKPLYKPDFYDTINRIRLRYSSRPADWSSHLLNNLSNSKSQQKKIGLHSVNETNYIALSEIISCEADGNYSTFRLTSGKIITSCVSIVNFEKILMDYGFARVHKSYLINLHHIDSFHRTDLLLRMTDNSVIPVSRRRKMDLLEHINKIHL